jgi:hypothetical protein
VVVAQVQPTRQVCFPSIFFLFQPTLTAHKVNINHATQVASNEEKKQLTWWSNNKNLGSRSLFSL